jgi:dTDP-4-dehydrorhamnose reductase
VKVLITGAGGQVGQALTSAPPTATEILATTHADLDITDVKSVAAFIAEHQPDLIINAAAYTAVDKAEAETEGARQVNELGARNLAAAAADCRARLIHISTDLVFDGASSVPYTTDAVPNPLGVYGTTKLAGEQAVFEEMPERAIGTRRSRPDRHSDISVVYRQSNLGAGRKSRTSRHLSLDEFRRRKLVRLCGCYRRGG